MRWRGGMQPKEPSLKERRSLWIGSACLPVQVPGLHVCLQHTATHVSQLSVKTGLDRVGDPLEGIAGRRRVFAGPPYTPLYPQMCCLLAG